MVAEESLLYRDLMRLKPDGWTANAWAVRAGVSRTVWTDMRRHGNPSRRTLEKLLSVAGSSLAEFEALRVGDLRPDTSAEPAAGVTDASAPGWRPAALPPLPLVASSSAGHWDSGDRQIALTELRPGKIIDQLPRPLSLGADHGAYALTIVAESMLPRFRPGRRVAVSPKAKVEIGDDVLITLSDTRPKEGTLVLIAELVRQTASRIELRQFSPNVTFTVEAGDILAIHKVMGELI
jgi:hypothetical protein